MKRCFFSTLSYWTIFAVIFTYEAEKIAASRYYPTLGEEAQQPHLGTIMYTLRGWAP